MMALTGLVGMACMLAAPLSQAGWHWHWHYYRHYNRSPVVYGPSSRHVWVHRSCVNGRCYVQRHVWVHR